MITENDKKLLAEWLEMNLQVTSKSNVELIVAHVDRYFSSSPSGESGVKPDLEFAKWLEENTRVVYEDKITLYRYHDNLDGWGNYILDDIYTVYDDKYFSKELEAQASVARDGDSSTSPDNQKNKKNE